MKDEEEQQRNYLPFWLTSMLPSFPFSPTSCLPVVLHFSGLNSLGCLVSHRPPLLFSLIGLSVNLSPPLWILSNPSCLFAFLNLPFSHGSPSFGLIYLLCLIHFFINSQVLTNPAVFVQVPHF